MKNLIKEILLEEKLYCYSDQYKDGFNEGLDKAIKILNQYNIITAPKQIKLSEILKYYNDKKNQYCLVPIKLDNGKYKIRVKYGDNYWEDYKLEIQNGKISPFSLNLPIPEFKWLYTLWIAETEIIDDMGEEENVNMD